MLLVMNPFSHYFLAQHPDSFRNLNESKKPLPPGLFEGGRKEEGGGLRRDDRGGERRKVEVGGGGRLGGAGWGGGAGVGVGAAAAATGGRWRGRRRRRFLNDDDAYIWREKYGENRRVRSRKRRRGRRRRHKRRGSCGRKTRNRWTGEGMVGKRYGKRSGRSSISFLFKNLSLFFEIMCL